MRDNLTVKTLLAIAEYWKALETLEMHINYESIVMSVDQREFPGLFDFDTMVPSEAISSDYDRCPLRPAIFGAYPTPMDEEGGIILSLTLL